MSLFLDLLIKVLPLYFMIGLGFYAGRLMQISQQHIADFTIYFVNPVVLFCMVWQADLSRIEAVIIPVMTLVFMLIVAGGAFLYGHFAWPGDRHKNLLAGQVMNGNSGYFGVPVAFALFPPEIANLWILAMLVSTILQVSLGYYLFATGNMSPLDGLKRLLKLAPFYAMIGGLLVNIAGIPWQEGLEPTYDMFIGAYFVLGMSIIGLSLSKLNISHFDLKYIGHAMIWRFMIWPILVIGFILFDQAILQSMSPEYYGLILLLGLLPIAADSAAYTVQLKFYPEKAAAAILISTLIALIYIPTIMVLFL